MTHRLIASIKRIIFILSVLVFGVVVNPVMAQAAITAEVDRNVVTLDEKVSLTVTLTGDFISIPVPDLSAVTDFSVASSGTSTAISFINGEMTAQGVYYFQLQPLKTGELVIPPISAEVDGLIYQTEPINITVTESSGANTPSTPPVDRQVPESLAGKNLFVEAEADNATPYLGEQVTYIFRFYQAADNPLLTLGRRNYRPPSFTNFWGQTVLDQPYYSTNLDGREYLVTEVRTAVFPANPGSLTIAPAVLEIPGDLFTAGAVLKTEPVSIDVQSLPEGAPADFNGAVGQFEMRAELDATTGKVNEPLTLYVDIEGDGNIEILTEPQLPDLPGWRIFESQSTSKTEVQDDKVYGRRRFERLLVPGQPGEYTFPAITFSYFDPAADEYRTLATDPIPITIEAGELVDEPPVVVLDSAKQPIQLVGNDIRHIKPVPTVLDDSGSLLLGQPLYWAFWILPVFIVAGVWVWQNRRQRLLKDTAYARSQRARRAALKILASAGQNDEDGYAAAQRALLGYLADKLNRPTVGLTTNELIDLLRQQKLDPELITRVQATLAEIDASRFAPIEETAEQSLVAQTRQLINSLEQSFGGKW